MAGRGVLAAVVGMSEPESEPAPAGRPVRLSILLAVITLLNAFGLVRGLLSRDVLLLEIPKLTPTLYQGWIVAAALSIIGAAGLWNLRRWGFYLLGLGWAIVVGVDLIVGATNHVIVATGVMWLLVLFVRPVKSLLR